MAVKLVIVESPAKAKTIGKFLGRGYKVEASNGHVRDLPKSQIGVDVERDFEPKYITIRGRGEVLDRIRKEAKTAAKVYLATDPDREGEAISWHLAHILGIRPDDACRIEFHEITAQAIKNAVKKPRTINQDLVDAQQARRVLDRLVGYKISPLLWAKVRKGLSAGRVQSVATRMIVDREDEIGDFVAREYWTVSAQMRSASAAFTARLSSLDGKKIDMDLSSQALAQDARARVEKADLKVTSVKRGERKRFPAPPFTTSNLQQEASRKLGFTTRKTMQVAQQLYEGVDIEGEGTVGLISYIRTDSTRLSTEAQEAARAAITERFSPDYLPETPPQYKGRKHAQDAHEAIRPTEVARTPASVKDSLTRDQLRLYKLVYDRFLASQMNPAVYDTLSATFEGGGVELRFAGQQLRFAGFMAVYVEDQDEPEEEDSALPGLNEGEAVAVQSVSAEQHFTQPPPRYTEAALVRALEEKGIGRPSTYAPTISTILQRDYIERDGKALRPTELGEVVTAMMKEHFSDVVDIAFTAGLEEQLDGVEEGTQPWRGVIARFYEPFAQELATAEQTIEKMEVKDEPSDVVCDKCGAMMVYKNGRFGRFLACPRYPECRNTKPIVVSIDAPCPKCGARLLERTSKKGRRFYGCERYPDCDFISSDQPVRQKCPECGGPMVLKRDRKGGSFHVCTTASCGFRVELEDEAGGEE